MINENISATVLLRVVNTKFNRSFNLNNTDNLKKIAIIDPAYSTNIVLNSSASRYKS